jgi:tRNA A37 methylthiotransferase MiaB
METYKFIEDWLISKCHIFPFSSHQVWETIPASKFADQIDEKIKKERYKRLEEIWNKKRQEFIKRNSWKEFKVLIESTKNEDWKLKWKGWTQNYIEAKEDNFEIISGEIKRNSIIVGNLK